ncbi:hypothetical protein [Euzebya tangerina]|uniref:hypothetical protein n=1 Tax=Euzebya tangerina TaxID=591198 RepID=UPI000E31557F|nr:hypothetical protein [Euzebya tangerina]
MAVDPARYDREAFERREAQARRLTLQRDGQRPIGENVEEGALLSKQATTLVGFVVARADAGTT